MKSHRLPLVLFLLLLGGLTSLSVSRRDSQSSPQNTATRSSATEEPAPNLQLPSSPGSPQGQPRDTSYRFATLEGNQFQTAPPVDLVEVKKTISLLALKAHRSSTEEITLNRELLLWARHEPEAATHWLNSQLDPTPFADTFRNVAVALAQDHHYDAAFAWADAINSPATRIQTIRDLYLLASNRDQVSPEVLHSLPLTLEERNFITQPEEWD